MTLANLCGVCFSFIVVVVAAVIGVLHNCPPFLPWECHMFSIHCPNIHSDSYSNIDFSNVTDTLIHWVENGEELHTQVSIFMNGREQFNAFASDSNRIDSFNSDSIIPIMSTSKNFAAILIALAIENGWISSLTDNVIQYWPNFPTKQRTALWKDKNKNNDQFTNKRKPRLVTIADVLRSEAGLCFFYNGGIYLNGSGDNATTLDSIRDLIESETLTFSAYYDTDRCYHAVARGYILNEIFRRVSPNNQSMAQYYEQNVFPILQSIDPNFYVSFRGINDSQHTLVDIESQPLLWVLWHYVLPILTSDKVWNANNEMCVNTDPSLCESEAMQSQFAERYATDFSSQSVSMRLMDYFFLDVKTFSPKSVSDHFKQPMAMEHMSFTGIGNAHSLALLFDYVWRNLLSEETRQLVISEPISRMDAFIGRNDSWTKGGFGVLEVNGIQWFQWGGWGGSRFAFSPEYDCVVVYLVTGFVRPTHSVLMDPRARVLLTIISQRLNNLPIST